MAIKLRNANPELIYLLDRTFVHLFTNMTSLIYMYASFTAVLGDAGQLYVAPDVIPVYRSMLPLSTIITPNWFEVE